MRLQNWTYVLALVVPLATAACTFNPGGVPEDAAGPPDADPRADDDGDGILNIDDNCDTVANPGQEDTDLDGTGNACDNCPAVPNPDQANTYGGDDGEGDACDDTDEDTVVDASDNCPEVANPGQENTRDNLMDMIGDACDDSDNDGTVDATDPCPLLDDPRQAYDEDGDGWGDPCDNCPSVANPDQADMMELEDTADGVGDACDPRPTEGGDSIAFFEGFSDAAVLGSGWTQAAGIFDDTAGTPYDETTGLWSISGGALTVSRTTTDPSILYRNMPATLGSVVVHTTLSVTSLPTNADLIPRPNVGLVAIFDNASAVAGGTDSGYTCSLEKRANGGSGTDSRTAIKIDPLNDVAAFESGDTMTLATNTTYQISQYHHRATGESSSNHICQSIDITNDTRRSEPYTSVGPESGRIGLFVRRAGVSFQNIVVYSIGGAIDCNTGSNRVCF